MCYFCLIVFEIWHLLLCGLGVVVDVLVWIFGFGMCKPEPAGFGVWVGLGLGWFRICEVLGLTLGAVCLHLRLADLVFYVLLIVDI